MKKKEEHHYYAVYHGNSFFLLYIVLLIFLLLLACLLLEVRFNYNNALKLIGSNCAAQLFYIGLADDVHRDEVVRSRILVQADVQICVHIPDDYLAMIYVRDDRVVVGVRFHLDALLALAYSNYDLAMFARLILLLLLLKCDSFGRRLGRRGRFALALSRRSRHLFARRVQHCVVGIHLGQLVVRLRRRRFR